MAPTFGRLAERLISTLALMQRFERNCSCLVKLAREVESHPIDDRFPPNVPYAMVGWLFEQERLLREVEVDFVSLLQAASSLEDMICNCAADLDSKGVAWRNARNNPDGSLPHSSLAVRRNTRNVLRSAFKTAGHDLSPLQWITKHRNVFTHDRYAFGKVIKEPGEIVFTSDTPAYPQTDHVLADTLTAKRAIQYALCVQSRFLPWFLSATDSQIP